MFNAEKDSAFSHPDVHLAISLAGDEDIASLTKSQLEFLSACIQAGTPARLGIALKAFKDRFNFIPFHPVKPEELNRWLEKKFVVCRIANCRVVEILNLPSNTNH